MAIIIIGAILIFIVSCVWTWHNLGVIERPRKIIFIIISLIIMYLITLMIFQMSKNGINYPSEEIEATTKNMLVAIFAGLNSLILIPYLAYVYGKYAEEDIEIESAIKRVIIGVVIFAICVFIETNYLNEVQQGILNMYREVQNAKG